MKLCCLQLPTPVYDREKNYETAERAVRAACEVPERPDVLLLPELWNVGYYPKEDFEKEADPDGARTRALMGELAAHYGVNIAAGSVATLREGRVYNTAYAFDRAGQVVGRYDKIHLVARIHEDKRFAGGESAKTFLFDGVRCGWVMCFDIRFPELARKLYLQGVELYLDPLQWPASKEETLRILARARAIENEAYFVCCNMSGHCFGRDYPGRSFAVDPEGTVFDCASAEPGVKTFTLDIDALRAGRAAKQLLTCRHPEVY